MLYDSHENSNKSTDCKQNKRFKNCISIKTKWIAGKKWLGKLPYKCQKQKSGSQNPCKSQAAWWPACNSSHGRQRQAIPEFSVWLREPAAIYKVEERWQMTPDFSLELSYVYLYIHTKHAHTYRHHTTDTKMQHKKTSENILKVYTGLKSRMRQNSCP